MYLSRMYLNPQRRGTRNLLTNPEALHATVLSAFPPNASGSTSEGRVLWRLDTDGGKLALYISSPTRPSFSHLQEQAGWENQESWTIHEYAPVLDTLSVGKQFAFRLAANPVRSVRDPETGKSKRKAHVTVARQRQWLMERAELIGVKFLEAEVGADSGTGASDAEFSDVDNAAVAVTRRETLKFKRRGRTVTIARTQFDGAFEIVDPEKLRSAMCNGIGKAKGYGCGLLTVAPIPRQKD